MARATKRRRAIDEKLDPEKAYPIDEAVGLLTEFAKTKFAEGGIPADKIHVKPNFVWRAKTSSQACQNVDPPYAVYVGRLTEEKGIGTLLSAMEHLKGQVKLRVVGDGPLRDQVVQASKENDSIVWLGHQPTEKVRETVRYAQCLIIP